MDKLHRRVRPYVSTAEHAAPKADEFSSRDRACVQRTLAPLRDAFGKQPLGFLSSEGSTLLCARPAEIHERLTAFLSSTSVVSGLVLSAMASAALSPFDLAEFDGDAPKRAAAELFNVLAAVTVVTQLCVVLYSIFTLYIFTASAHTPAAAYRAVLHMTRWIGFLEVKARVPPLSSRSRATRFSNTPRPPSP